MAAHTFGESGQYVGSSFLADVEKFFRTSLETISQGCACTTNPCVYRGSDEVLIETEQPSVFQGGSPRRPVRHVHEGDECSESNSAAQVQGSLQVEAAPQLILDRGYPRVLSRPMTPGREHGKAEGPPSPDRHQQMSGRIPPVVNNADKDNSSDKGHSNNNNNNNPNSYKDDDSDKDLEDPDPEGYLGHQEAPKVKVTPPPEEEETAGLGNRAPAAAAAAAAAAAGAAAGAAAAAADAADTLPGQVADSEPFENNCQELPAMGTAPKVADFPLQNQVEVPPSNEDQAAEAPMLSPQQQPEAEPTNFVSEEESKEEKTELDLPPADSSSNVEETQTVTIGKGELEVDSFAKWAPDVEAEFAPSSVDGKPVPAEAMDQDIVGGVPEVEEAQTAAEALSAPASPSLPTVEDEIPKDPEFTADPEASFASSRLPELPDSNEMAGSPDAAAEATADAAPAAPELAAPTTEALEVEEAEPELPIPAVAGQAAVTESGLDGQDAPESSATPEATAAAALVQETAAALELSMEPGQPESVTETMPEIAAALSPETKAPETAAETAVLMPGMQTSQQETAALPEIAMATPVEPATASPETDSPESTPARTAGAAEVAAEVAAGVPEVADVTEVTEEAEIVAAETLESPVPDNSPESLHEAQSDSQQQPEAQPASEHPEAQPAVEEPEAQAASEEPELQAALMPAASVLEAEEQVHAAILETQVVAEEATAAPEEAQAAAVAPPTNTTTTTPAAEATTAEEAPAPAEDQDEAAATRPEVAPIKLPKEARVSISEDQDVVFDFEPQSEAPDMQAYTPRSSCSTPRSSSPFKRPSAGLRRRHLTNVTEQRVLKTGLLQLHSLLNSDTEDVELPQDIYKKILSGSFLQRLLKGDQELKSSMENDVAAAQSDLRHLPVRHLLNIRVPTLDFQTTSGTHSARQNFLNTVDKNLFGKLPGTTYQGGQPLPRGSEAQALHPLGFRIAVLFGAAALLRSGWGQQRKSSARASSDLDPEVTPTDQPSLTEETLVDASPSSASDPAVVTATATATSTLTRTDSCDVDAQALPTQWAIRLPAAFGTSSVAVVDVETGALYLLPGGDTPDFSITGLQGPVAAVCDRTKGTGANRSLHWEITIVDPARHDVLHEMEEAGLETVQRLLTDELQAALASPSRARRSLGQQ